MLGCIGFGLYWFTSYAGIPDSGLETLSASIWTRAFKVCVILFVAICFYRRVKFPRVAFYLALVIQACTLVLMVVNRVFYTNFFLFFFIIQGYAVAVFSLLFAQFLSSYHPRISRISIPASFILAHSVLALPPFILPEIREYVFAACVIVAVGLLRICVARKQLLCPTQEFLLAPNTLKPSGTRGRIAVSRAVNWPLLFENILVYGMGLVVFPVLNGAVAQISYVADINSGLRDLITQVFCMSALLVVIAVTVLTDKPINCAKFTIILIPVVVTALSVTPFFWDNTPFSSSIIIKCIYVIYTSIIWVSLAEKAYAKPEKTIFFFCSLGFPALCLPIGRELGASLSATNQLNFGTMAGFSIGAIWLILMVGMLFLGFFYKNKRPAALQATTASAENTSASLSPTDKYLNFSRDAGLSKRETEILIEFAQGRSAIYISKNLSISKHTVKSHLRRIYAKANVHNRQELLDLIARSAARSDAPSFPQ